MSKNILLVFASLKEDPKMVGGEVYRPPLGILTIAGTLVEAGYSVTIIDERVEQEFDKILKKELDKIPLCVGISSMSGWHLLNSLRISKFIKETTKIPTVWGGVHTSLFPESVLKNNYVDYIVRDDGEETFPALLKCLDGGSLSDFEKIKGIGFKRDGNTILTEIASPADINSLPRIPFHLIDFEKYTIHSSREISPKSGFNAKHNIPIETSRGCPFSCGFCTESKRKKKWRMLSPERVINDIKYYKETTGIRGFSFVDDNFFGNKKRGKEIIELLIKEEVGISWDTNVTANFMAGLDEEFLHKLERSGCKFLVMGAETGSPRISKLVDVKKATVDDIINANRKLAKTNIVASFIFIQGFPTETLDDIKKTYLLNIKLLKENKNAINSNVFLIPTPGTRIAEMALGEKIKNMSLEDWGRIFDLRMEEKHPWVLKETYEFIKSNRYMFGVFRLTNRVPKSINKILYLFLWSFRIKLKYGFDIKIDRYVLNLLFNNYQFILKILKRVFKINLVGV